MPTRVMLVLTAVAALVSALAAVVFPSSAVVPTARTATPPMGWNDWNAYGCAVDEQDIVTTIDLLVSRGLRDAGYRYVTIDDCWAAPTRDSQVRLRADPVRFPHGIAALADLAHRSGLQLGIYSSAGSATCTGAQPGSLGHEETDVATFVAWGVDYLKYDNCGRTPGYAQTQVSYTARYRVMAEAIATVARRTGRTLVYSVCEWGVFRPWQWAAAQGDLWRTTYGLVDTWAGLLDTFRRNVVLDRYAGPGAWNDPDMLQVGNGGMTETEYRSQFSLWAMMAAPLVIGTDLSKASPDTLATLGNRRVIAIDQDPLGVQAHLVSDSGGLYVLAKPLSDGTTAVALFNSTSVDRAVSTSAEATGAGSRGAALALTDLWSGTVTETGGTITALLRAHETVVYRVSPAVLARSSSTGANVPVSSL